MLFLSKIFTMHSMLFKRLSGVLTLGVVFLYVSLAVSCNSAKKVTYFKDIPDSSKIDKKVTMAPFIEPTIQPNDNLFISVETIDQRNVAVSNTREGSSKDAAFGYTVDQKGYIEVPLVGHVALAGLTTTQAKETIRVNASKYFVDPIVNVRFLNSFVHVGGDVARPGKFPITDEKISILDAVSMAGDLTMTARRDNILLVREENGVKKFIRFNFNSSEIFQSPYFYLRNGDYIYVEPIKAKSRVATSDTSKDRFITLGSAFLSIVTVIVTIASLSK
jgi:polysaccharide export outer membrane protein